MTSVSIDNKNQEVKFSINTQLYGNEFVQEALYAYSKTCWVQVKGNPNNKLTVILKPKVDKINLKTLGFEFYNYILGLIQNATS